MQQQIIEILKKLKTKDKNYNNIIDQRIKDFDIFNDIPWRYSKNVDFENLFSEFDLSKSFNIQKNKINIKQKAGEKRNIIIKFNGTIVASESAEDGIELLPIHDALMKYPNLVDQGLANRKLSRIDLLSKSAFKSGYFIYVHDDVLKEPSTIYIYSSLAEDNLADLSYNIILVGKNNNIKIINEFLPVPFEGSSLSSTYEDIFIKENANCKYINIHCPSENVSTILTSNIFLSESAYFDKIEMIVGGKIINQNVNAYLNGENSDFNLHGVGMPDGEQVFETFALINNIAKNTQGKVLFKNVLSGKAKSFFDGMIKVNKGADFTNSYLEDHTLILSDDARSDSIPGLEIEANEVKASHGATVGGINEAELFYAISRGLDENQAKTLLISGFIKPLVDLIQDEEIEKRVMLYFNSKLKKNEN